MGFADIPPRKFLLGLAAFGVLGSVGLIALQASLASRAAAVRASTVATPPIVKPPVVGDPSAPLSTPGERVFLAKNLLADPSPANFDEAEGLLKANPKTDPDHAVAQKLLSGIPKARVAYRVAMADQLQNSYLDDGKNVKVRVSGSNKDVITLTWVMVDEVQAHAMEKDWGALNGMKQAGFKRFIMADGYGKSFNWDLSKME